MNLKSLPIVASKSLVILFSLTNGVFPTAAVTSSDMESLFVILKMDNLKKSQNGQDGDKILMVIRKVQGKKNLFEQKIKRNNIHRDTEAYKPI